MHQALYTEVISPLLPEKELLSSLPFKEQCGDQDMLPAVYEVLLNKYQNQVSSPAKPNLPHPRLSDNLDMEVAKAERLYYACAYRQSFAITEEWVLAVAISGLRNLMQVLNLLWINSIVFL